MPTSAHGPAGVRPLRTTIFSRSKIATPQSAAAKAAASPRQHHGWMSTAPGSTYRFHASRRVVPSSARGWFQGGDTTVCPLLGALFFPYSFRPHEKNVAVGDENLSVFCLRQNPPPLIGEVDFNPSATFEAAFGPGRKHSLLPALATNSPLGCLFNASRP